MPMRKDIFRSRNGVLGPNMIALFDSLALSSKVCFVLLSGKPKGRYRGQAHEPQREGCGARGHRTRDAHQLRTVNASSVPSSPVQRWHGLGHMAPARPILLVLCPGWGGGGGGVLPSVESGRRVMGAA